MKHLLLILMLGFVSCGVFAQSDDSDILAADRNHWTVTASYDASLPGKWKVGDSSIKMFKPGSGVSVGADYLLLLGKGFFFEPGARLYFDSYRYDNITVGAGSAYEPAMTYDPPVRKIGLRIPLTVGYKFDIFKRGSLFLSTGPEATVGFSARTKVDDGQTEIFEENLYKNQMRRYDVAWDVRAAVLIDRFRVDLTGSFGLLDVIKTAASMHESRLSIGVGYAF